MKIIADMDLDFRPIIELAYMHIIIQHYISINIFMDSGYKYQLLLKKVFSVVM
jgi:hypothetical protein